MGPEVSNTHYTQVIDALRESGGAFHAVTLGRMANLSVDVGIVLERGSQETGGSYSNLFAGSALPERMKKLAVELTRQHRVVYARPQSLIPPERITVTAARPGLTVRGTVPMTAVQEQP
jgi:hypothetical protein